MNIEQFAGKVKDELSGYYLSGYEEICAPAFKRTLHCLLQVKGQISIISEFVLQLVFLGMEIEVITKLLGLDGRIVEKAWWDLVHHEFIDARNGKITDIGSNYITERNYDKIEDVYIKVYIDGLSGAIRADNGQLMKSQNVKEIGLRSLRPVINEPSIDILDFSSVKRIIKNYNKEEDDETFEGELLDIVEISGRKTEYKKLRLIMYSNDKDESTRIAVYDGNTKIDCYESAVLTVDSNGYQLIKPIQDNFPEIELSNFISPNKILNCSEIFDAWNKAVDNAKEKIFIVLPLLDLYTPNDEIIDRIIKVAHKGINITIAVSGREFSSKFQKGQYERLFLAQGKFNNILITQIPRFINKTILVDDLMGIISKLNRHKLYLETTKEGYVEEGNVFDNEYVSILYNEIFNPELKQIRDFKPMQISSSTLKGLIEDIIKLIYLSDDKLKAFNNIGWLGQSVIPNLTNLNNIPIVYDEDSFKTFVNLINQSFTEIIDLAGKLERVKEYFWKDFKSICPSDLFRVLSKIRMYRNSVLHIEIDTKYKASYYDFLDEDLNGRLPQFVKQGFKHLQAKLLTDLKNCLINFVKS